jgi:hypothetical protein
MAVTLVVYAAGFSKTALTPAGDGYGPVDQGPLPFGVKSDLADAQDAINATIPMPKVPFASSDNVSAIWADTSNKQVAVQFDDGSITMMIQPSLYADPLNDLKQRAAGINAAVSVLELAGGPALVIVPDTDTTDADNPAWVEYVLSGLDINIYSESRDEGELVKLADSLIQASPTG